MRNTMRHFPADDQRPPVIENSALLASGQYCPYRRMAPASQPAIRRSMRKNVPATAPAAGCRAARLVWCRSGVVSLTSPEGDRERWSYADLVEAAEQTVRRYEELELGLDLAAAGA